MLNAVDAEFLHYMDSSVAASNTGCASSSVPVHGQATGNANCENVNPADSLNTAHRALTSGVSYNFDGLSSWKSFLDAGFRF